MRNIVFTRGAAGAGKTTFLKESEVLEYAISPDNLRLFFQAPTMNIKGGLGKSITRKESLGITFKSFGRKNAKRRIYNNRCYSYKRK
jgi:ABC-type ATPase involved in cell division